MELLKECDNTLRSTLQQKVPSLVRPKGLGFASCWVMLGQSYFSAERDDKGSKADLTQPQS
jgi:hypothetical protein